MTRKKLTTETWVIYADDKKGEMAFSTLVIQVSARGRNEGITHQIQISVLNKKNIKIKGISPCIQP